jgi:hypothetical protein
MTEHGGAGAARRGSNERVVGEGKRAKLGISQPLRLLVDSRVRGAELA